MSEKHRAPVHNRLAISRQRGWPARTHVQLKGRSTVNSIARRIASYANVTRQI